MHSRRTRVACRLSCFLAALLCVPAYASAQTPAVVRSTADSGAGSLRQLIANAPWGGIVMLGPELAGRTITLQSTLVVDKQIFILGDSAPGAAISGNDAVRIFDFGANGAACNARPLLYGVRLVRGKAPAGEYGGAIRTCAWQVELARVTIEDSSAERGG